MEGQSRGQERPSEVREAEAVAGIRASLFRSSGLLEAWSRIRARAAELAEKGRQPKTSPRSPPP